MRYLHTLDPRDAEAVVAENNPTPDDESRVVKIEFFKDGALVVLTCDCATIEEAYRYAVKRGADPFKTIRYTFAA